jgi:hypothetical protein
LLQFQHYTGGTQHVDFQTLVVAFPNDNNRVSRKLDHVPAVSMNNLQQPFEVRVDDTAQNVGAAMGNRGGNLSTHSGRQTERGF